ncbi:uncharacterized protein LOC144471412 [Augochlora pura]
MLGSDYGIIAPLEPTCYTGYGRPSSILLSNSSSDLVGRITDNFNTMHRPVIVTARTSSAVAPLCTETNWDLYQQLTNKWVLDKILTSQDDIDDTIAKPNSHLISCQRETVVSSFKPNRRNPEFSKDHYLVALIRLRRTHRRVCQSSCCEDARQSITILTSRIKSRIYRPKNMDWRDKVGAFRRGDPTFWATYVSLVRGKPTQMPPLVDDFVIYTDIHDKVEALATAFEHVPSQTLNLSSNKAPLIDNYSVPSTTCRQHRLNNLVLAIQNPAE